MEKLCVFCEHCEFTQNGAHGDYPDPAHMTCKKGHFNHIEKSVWNVEDLRRIIIVAETCQDYKQVKP